MKMEEGGCCGCSCGCLTLLLILGILILLGFCGMLFIGLFGYEIDWGHYLQQGVQSLALFAQVL